MKRETSMKHERSMKRERSMKEIRSMKKESSLKQERFMKRNIEVIEKTIPMHITMSFVFLNIIVSNQTVITTDRRKSGNNAEKFWSSIHKDRQNS